MRIILYIISSLSLSIVYAGNDLTFYTHGNAIQSYKNDRVILGDKTVKLKTTSPTFSHYPNAIGEFEAPITKNSSKKIKDVIRKLSQKIKSHNQEPLEGATIEELHLKNEKKKWTSLNNTPAIKQIREEFLKIAKKAYKIPIRAISLKCSQDKNNIICHYQNIGKKEVHTIDPIGIPYSISCLDILGHKKNLYELKEYHPKKMKPKKIKINPKETYSFLIKTDHTCNHRIVVKTTDMMINNNYNDVLLGELISNQLD